MHSNYKGLYTSQPPCKSSFQGAREKNPADCQIVNSNFLVQPRPAGETTSLSRLKTAERCCRRRLERGRFGDLCLQKCCPYDPDNEQNIDRWRRDVYNSGKMATCFPVSCTEISLVPGVYSIGDTIFTEHCTTIFHLCLFSFVYRTQGFLSKLTKRITGEQSPYSGHFEILRRDGSVVPVYSEGQNCLYHAVAQATNRKSADLKQEAVILRNEVKHSVSS